MKFRNYLGLFLFILSCTATTGQGWERFYYGNTVNQRGREVFTTADGGYLVRALSPSSIGENSPAYLKTDFEGRDQSFNQGNCISDAFNHPDFIHSPDFYSTQLPSGNFVSLGQLNLIGSDTFQVIEVVDPNGIHISCSTIPIGDYIVFDIEAADNNSIYVSGTVGSEIVLKKMMLDGTVLWEKRISGYGNGTKIRQTNDGGVLLVAVVDAGAQGNGSEFYQYTSDGTQIWSYFIQGFPRSFPKPVFDASGHLYFGGNYWVSGGGEEIRIYKIDALGAQIGLYTYPVSSQTGDYSSLFELEINDQNELLFGTNHQYLNTLLNYAYKFSIGRLDQNMNLVWEKEFNDHFSSFANFTTGRYLKAFDFLPLNNGGFVITGTERSDRGISDQIFLFKTDSLGNTFTNQICGKIALDRNSNCMVDSTENVQNIYQIMQLIQNGDTLTYASGILGDFQIQTDTGDYELRLLSSNPLWEPCQSSFFFNIQGQYDTTKVNFALKPLIECPNLSIDVGSTRLRRCRTSTFTVNYCNEGTIDALDSYVEVQLPAELTLTSSDIPGTLQANNTWKFDLGTVELFDCGFFRFEAKVDCNNSVTGKTLCTEANIFPDTLCVPPSANWSRASLDISGECQGDSIVFNIKNIGNGDMLQEKQYIVIEDIAVMRLGSPFQLTAGETIRVPVEATGSTVRLEVPQPDNHPFAERTSATIEFCGNPPFSSGFFNQLGHDTGNPAKSTYCSQVLNGYDPNEKLTTPTGFRTAHEIYADQPLDYEIHFQNTGNDTAFQVILLDTISSNLDLSTLRVGASSHTVDWDMFGDRILRFKFDNIGLVDSFTNEPGSRGFIRYTIKAKEGLGVATKINNAADIYFDYNPPIHTNQTFHTIGFDDFDNDGFTTAVDCNDLNPATNPGATEIPNNNIDEDCDGIALIIDNDMDGFNSDEDCDDTNAAINPNATEIPNNNIDENCDGSLLTVDNDMDGFNSDEDCDDANAAINPNATEIPNNNIDEDCDGIALIIDNDMDGFNSDEDCDDTNAAVNPNATEIPNNNVDEDCDGIALIIDNDMDGFNSDEDCDDANAAVNPNATEIPNNNVDEDCDGIALIIDNDMDGFNSDEDCDDANAAVNPNAAEIPNNNVDEDCDGIALIIDNDMDGFNSDEDCDDTNAAINPGTPEIPNNNVDEDCDGIALIIDNDMDGFNSDEDCDDENAAINPDALEIPNNGIDDDCDGFDLISGTVELNSKSLKVYPNPFSESVHFEVLENASNISIDKNTTFSIFDFSGKLVHHQPFETNRNGQNERFTFERNNLPSGIYFYEIKGVKEKVLIGKLVIQ